jgi:adenylate cyclase
VALRQIGHPVVLSYMLASLMINILGSMVSYTLLQYAVPKPENTGIPDLSQRLSVAFIIVTAVAFVASFVFAVRDGYPALTWLARGGSPRREENNAVIRESARRSITQWLLWLVAAVVMGASMVGTRSVEFVALIFITVAMTGAGVCVMIYIVSERILRPITTRAMEAYMPGVNTAPGVATRVLMVWGLTSALPVLGIILLSVGQLTGRSLPVSAQINITVLFLTGIAVVAGLGGLFMVAKSISDPLKQVSRAMQLVQAGNLEARVPVYDGSEIGRLQAGFNRMVHGLRDRERLSDLLSRHVGEDVARQAIEHGNVLGGELRHVAVLFIDLVGSTRMAAVQPPDVVVALINEFFALVVDSIHEHGGTVSKFEGDAALAVFGAPVELPDAAGATLAARSALNAASYAQMTQWRRVKVGGSEVGEPDALTERALT